MIQKKIKIGDTYIGEGYPCFIIAEAGVNHNGQLSIAKKLVDAAVIAGADAVKFQTFKAEGVVTKYIEPPSYAKKNIGRKMTQQELIKKLELSYKKFQEIKQYCDTKKIIFLSTPHSFDAIDFLKDLVPLYKFGSGDLLNIPALQYAARTDKPMILGTGMATISEIRLAIKAIHSVGNNKIIVLHCTTNYPCSLEEVNLRAMLTIRRMINCPVGYSDHTLGITVPIMAATLGATVIEKHFTLKKTLPGPDHKASLKPNEFKNMVQAIRNVETALGSYVKKPTITEKEIMKYVRKSIVSNTSIKKGNIIRNEMIGIKRPGIGLSPTKLHKILGKRAKRLIKKDELILVNMVE